MAPLARHVVDNRILEILEVAETIVKRKCRWSWLYQAVVPRDGTGCSEIHLIGKESYENSCY
jgi:hypothetical protein